MGFQESALRSQIVVADAIERQIHRIRGHRILLDSDLAPLYEVPTSRLNEAVKRNRQRFPQDFMFQLTAEEAESLISQIAISKSGRGGRRTLPYAFTEQGGAMLSSVLNSERAILVNIAIMRVFVQLRELMTGQSSLAEKIEALERKYAEHDEEIQVIFTAIKELLEPSVSPGKRRIGFSA